MADEDTIVDTSTPSTTDTPASTTQTEHDPGEVVQRDKESTRRSIKDTLRAAVEESKKEPSPARQAAAAQRAREEQTGKFAPEPKDKDKTPAQSSAKVEQPAKAAAAPEATPQSQAAKPETAQAAGSTPAATPPSSWPKEAKDGWTSLPPAVQQAVAKREKEVADGFAQYQARTKDIDQAFAPYRSALQQFGKTEGQAISQMMGWHAALANPQTQANAFRALAQSHGFNLETLVQPSGQQQQQDPNDPRAVLNQYVAPMLSPLAAQLQNLQSAYEREQAARQQEQATRVQSEIGEFSKDKPHFEKVRVRMGQLMAAGAATSLDDAYHQAVWADSETRTEMLSAEQAKREADAKAAADAAQAKAAADAEAKRKAETEAAAKARKANVSVRGSTPVGTSLAPNRKGSQSVRDTIKAVVEERRTSI
jgi:hypothetical protein